MDWTTSAVLAALLWADGIRRVPAGALIVRRVLAGPWRVQDVADASGPRAVGWWPPLSLALVLTEPSAERTGGIDLRARMRTVGLPLRVLRVLGCAVVAGLVFGVPFAARHHGAFGLAIAASVLLLLGLGCATTTAVALRRLGLPRSAALRASVPLVWPFSGPSAAERVLAHAVSGAAPIRVVEHLLRPEDFAHWMRPLAHDVLNGATPRVGAATLDGDALLRAFDAKTLAAFVDTPPPHLGNGNGYCARCGAEYRPDVRACAECEGVTLSSPSVAAKRP